MDTYEKKYKEAQKWIESIYPNLSHEQQMEAEAFFPELKESENEKIRKELISLVENWKIFNPNSPFDEHPVYTSDKDTVDKILAWLEKQGEQKELNFVEILKHYPKETELYSPLYGKLWLAEVDEENGIITCYKYPLNEGCTRAILEQEDTVSFYSNGTTGLPDYTISKDCMLFLYDIEKQGEQKPIDPDTLIQQRLDALADIVADQKHTDKVEPKFHKDEWITIKE